MIRLPSFYKTLTIMTLGLIAVSIAQNRADAATFTVTNTSDALNVDGACSAAGTGDGCTLREAITTANDTAGADTITFAPDVSYQILVNAPTFPTINSDITIQGPGASALRIQGKGQALARLLTIESGSVVISGLNFTSAYASSAFYNNGSLTLNSCCINNNHGVKGGAIYNDSSGTLVLSNSYLYGNSADSEGGAIYNSGTATLRNSNISGNNASTGDGGAIKNDNTLTVDSCTFFGNSSARGTGLFNTATLDLSNTIISGSIYGPVTSGDYNLVTTTYNGTLPGSHNILGQDPKLSTSIYDGAATTMALMPDSPAIDAGNTALAIDQRGYTRPVGSAPDIGAFEYSPPPTGTNFIVTTTDDHDDGSCTSSDCSLREAVTASNTNNNPAATDTITFADNVRGTINVNTAKDSGVYGINAFTLSQPVSIQGPGAGSLTVRRDTGGNYRLFLIKSGVAVTLSGLTLSNGSSPFRGTVNDNGPDTQTMGGGIYNLGSLTVTNCSFSEHVAKLRGGAIHNVGTLTVQDCAFANNSSGSGGAITNDSGKTATVQSSMFTSNMATQGAALQNLGTLVLTNSRVTQNTSSNNGGAIVNNATLTVQTSTLWANVQGIKNIFGTINLSNSTLSGNIKGAIQTSGSGTITNCTITNNGLDATGQATGICIDFKLGDTNLSNTIVAGSTNNTAYPDVAGAFVSQGYNLIGIVGAATGFTAPGDKIGRTFAPLDPKLAPLGANGGTTLTHALLPGSPAIDGGSGTGTDQRGKNRPIDFASVPNPVGGNGSDIGAFEVEAGSPAAFDLTATPNPVVVGTALNLTLRAVDANGYTAEGYRGSVHFTSSDAEASLPADYTFTDEDAGVHVFPITLNTLGPQSVSVTDDVSSFSKSINVIVAEKPSLQVTTTSDTSTNTDAQTSLREAIAYANTLTGPQTIGFNAALGGQTITLNGTQLPAVTGTLTLVTPAGGLTLDGDKKSRILAVNEGANLTLTDLALNNGNGSLGAGLHNEGTIALSRCSFSGNVGNVSPVSGGGLFNKGSATLVDCRFTNNTCILGGGLYNQNGGTMICTRVTASNNSGNNGAGMANYGTLTVIDSHFTGNTSNFGSAIYNANVLTMSSSVLSQNFGSALFNGGDAKVDQSTFDSNSGGGISNSSALALTNCTISNNTGSGISTANMATISNCTIVGNTSSSGGGILNNAVSGMLVTVSNCTISGNSAPFGKGGSIFNAGPLSISNTLLNAAPGCENLVNDPAGFGHLSFGSVTSKGYNLSSDDASAYLNQSSDQNGVDPKLGPLADNGGPTPTVALLAGSPAINSGDPAVKATGDEFDQRGAGFSRVRDGRLDIGAFEVQNDAPVISSVTLDNTSPKTNDTLAAQVQATDADGDALTYSYQWTKNGVPITGETKSQLDLSQTDNGDRDDTISVIVTVSDAYRRTKQSSDSATVQNSVPAIPSVTIEQSAPKTGDTLSFAVGAVTDADGDTPTFTYQWKKNGVPIEGAISLTLDLSKVGNGDQGDKIAVVVTADDGHGGTTSKESEAITVGGSAPTSLSLSSTSVAENQPAGTGVGTFSTNDADGGTFYTYALVAGEGDRDNSAFSISGNRLLSEQKFDFETKNLYHIRISSKDEDGQVVESSFAITITNVNEAPSAKVTLAPTSPTTNTSLQATVTGLDAEGHSLSYSYQWKRGETLLSGETGATLNLAKAGNGDKGERITVTVVPSDGALTGATASASVLVVNSAPTLTATTFQGRENQKLSAQLGGQDADKDALTYSLVSNVRYGTLSLGSNGSFTYTPRLNWNGTDSFQARVRDVSGATATATITLIIAPLNGIPVALNDVVKGVEDVPLSIPAATLLRNDSNGESSGEVDALQIVRVAVPAGFPGTLRLDVAKQTLLFTPKANWNGTTTFTYTLQDSGRALAMAQVTLQIAAVNDAPVALAGRLSVLSGTLGELVLSGSDVEGDALTFALAAKPVNGLAQVVKVGDKWVLRYQSKVGFTGTDTLAVIARDGKLNSSPATITITVTANSAPTLVSLTPNKGTLLVGSTIVFEQKVRDLNGTAHLDATALLIGNLPTAANARGGATLWFDAVLNQFTLTKDDGVSTLAPVALGGTLENSQVKVTLGAGDVARDKYGVLTLRWRVTFKPSFVGTKSLWMRVEDLGGLSAGFTKSGDITLTPITSGAPISSSAGSS